MAILGRLICATCNQQIGLGKHVVDDSGGGMGFWHGVDCGELGINALPLGQKVLRFLAAHINHDIICATDDKELAVDYRPEYPEAVDDRFGSAS